MKRSKFTDEQILAIVREGEAGRKVADLVRTHGIPARQFTVHGERRSFALLRAVHDLGAQQQVRDLVLRAYDTQAEHPKEHTA